MHRRTRALSHGHPLVVRRDAFIRPLARTDQGGQAMHRFVRLMLAIAIAAAAVTRPAHAAEGTAKPAAGSVAVELTAQRVTKAQGKEVLVAADQAKPGELIEYRALYRNDGASEAKGLMATLPIPRGTQYVAGTAEPRGVEASLDGRTVVQDVPVSEYRTLRWPLGVLPTKQSRTVAARVRVETTTVAENAH